MSGRNLKERTISGMIWSSFGKFGTMGLNFLTNLVLARLLMPSDFGAIGMLQIFIAISGVFVTAGFGSALIQKKCPTHIDYSSVFFWNLTAAFLFYVILFFCSPAIARFYNIAELCPILRVQSLSLIIQAFATVQSNQLQKQLRFRELSIRNVIASLVGTVTGIVFALLGYGVWSLVFSHLLSALSSVFLLWYLSSWRPTWEFSWQSLKELFSFGGLMALSSLVERVYNHIQGLIIGKFFTASDLGYYTQAKRMEEIPTEALSQIVNQVSFPVFSELQDEIDRLLVGVRKNINAISYLNFPLMALLIVIAEPLVTLLYGHKWIESVPYLQILCLAGAIYSINTISTNVIKSLGKSKIYFIIQFTKRLLGIIFILCSIRWGVMGLMWAVTLYSYMCILINSFVCKRLIGYGLLSIIKDVGKNAIVSIIVGVVTYLLCSLSINMYLRMCLQIILFLGLFLLLSIVFKLDGFRVYSTVLNNYLSKRFMKR